MADDKQNEKKESQLKMLNAKRPMPRTARRKGKRRYFVSDENGVLKEAQIAGVPGEGGTVGVWGVQMPAGVDYGQGSSTDETDTGEVQEFPDDNGEAQGLIFLNNHAENTYEFLMLAATTPPAFGDVINTSEYVTRVQIRSQAKGWQTLSIQTRTI